MTDQNALKRAVAAKALEYVQDGMKLGLGSGSTAEMFVEQLAPRVRGGEKLLCVPTSERTASLARKLGLTLASLDDLAPLTLPRGPALGGVAHLARTHVDLLGRLGRLGAKSFLLQLFDDAVAAGAPGRGKPADHPDLNQRLHQLAPL